MKGFFFYGIMFAALLSNHLTATPIKEGEVEFTAEASPGFLEITGEGAKLSGDITVKDGKASGTFTCDLTPIKTGLSLRDQHMHEKYLETGKYPKAIFTLDPVQTGGDRTFTGTLELHGVKKKISGTAEIGEREATAKFKINTSDFKIKQASYKLVTLAEVVHVEVTVSF